MSVAIRTVMVDGMALDLLGPGWLDVAPEQQWTLAVFLDSGHVDPGECHVVAVADDGTRYQGAASASISERSSALAGNPSTVIVTFAGLGALSTGDT